MSRLHHTRAVRATASILWENLNPGTTVIGLDIKALAGVVFAATVANKSLEAEVRVLGLRAGVTATQMDEAAQFALSAETKSVVTDEKVNAALVVAKAASPSPAEITPQVVEVWRHSGLSSPALVELVTWISVLQMLHRLSVYYTGEGNAPSSSWVE